MSSKRNYTKEEMQQRLTSLPSDIQELLYSPDMTNALNQIAKQHSLHIDQMGILEAEVAAAMLGFTEPQDFPQMLEEALGVNAAIAKSIADDVNMQLFQKIRESLKKMTGFNAEEEKKPKESKPAAIEAAPGKPAPFVKTIATVTPIRPAEPQPGAKPAAIPTIQAAPMAKPPVQAIPVVKTPISAAPTTPSASPVTISLSKEPVEARTEQKTPAPEPHPADAMLEKSTVTLPKMVNTGLPPLGIGTNLRAAPSSTDAPTEPLAKKEYAADPYQEPID